MRRHGASRALKFVGILLGVLGLYLVAAGSWAYVVTPKVIARATRAPLIELGSLPDSTVQILLRVEDPGFRKHKGLDPFTKGQGRSTLTRSLARVLYLYRYDLPGAAGIGQTVFRFIDKFTGPANLAPDAMALVLNRRVSKDRQIRLFLQHAYMGELEGQPIYGFANAARVYFGKRRVRDLSRRYVIVLVGMMVGPDRFHPIDHPDALGDRALRIERLLRRQCAPSGPIDVYYAACAAPRRSASR